MTVRAADISDSTAIGLVHVRSWQAVYKGHFPQPFLDGLDPVQRSEHWAQLLRSGPNERESTLVLELDGGVVGFSNVGPSRDHGAAVTEGEVRAIYLMPDQWSQGLGKQLMGASLDHLVRVGFSEAILWVLDRNGQARRFYEIGGWTADGGFKEDESFGFSVAEVRYRRALP